MLQSSNIVFPFTQQSCVLGFLKKICHMGYFRDCSNFVTFGSTKKLFVPNKVLVCWRPLTIYRHLPSCLTLSDRLITTTTFWSREVNFETYHYSTQLNIKWYHHIGYIQETHCNSILHNYGSFTPNFDKKFYVYKVFIAFNHLFNEIIRKQNHKLHIQIHL